MLLLLLLRSLHNLENIPWTECVNLCIWMVVIATAASFYWFSLYYSGHCDLSPVSALWQRFRSTKATARRNARPAAPSPCPVTPPPVRTLLIDLVGLGSISILWNETRYRDVLSGIKGCIIDSTLWFFYSLYYQRTCFMIVYRYRDM